MLRLVEQALKENNIATDPEKNQKFVRYLELIAQWNRVYNLTAITDPKEMVYLHLIDSLLVQPYLEGDRLLDIGTGAGLPGIPLAIADPSKEWTLVDKVGKKVLFLTQAVAELNLKNVTAVQIRIEEFKSDKLFTSILSRAFGSLSLFVQLTKHLIAKNGKLIAMKGRYPEDELANIPTDMLSTVHALAMKGCEVERSIVVIERTERG